MKRMAALEMSDAGRAAGGKAGKAAGSRAGWAAGGVYTGGGSGGSVHMGGRDHTIYIREEAEGKTPVYDGNLVIFRKLFEISMVTKGLAHTLQRSDKPRVMIHGPARSVLVEAYGSKLVDENERALGHPVEATEGAQVQMKIRSAGSVEGAWREAHRCCLPTSNAGKEALRRSLSCLNMRVGQHPRD